MDLTRGSGISAASAFLAAEMMSDADPLLSLDTAGEASGRDVDQRPPRAWRAELVAQMAEFAILPDQRARVVRARVSA